MNDSDKLAQIRAVLDDWWITPGTTSAVGMKRIDAIVVRDNTNTGGASWWEAAKYFAREYHKVAVVVDEQRDKRLAEKRRGDTAEAELAQIRAAILDFGQLENKMAAFEVVD